MKWSYFSRIWFFIPTVPSTKMGTAIFFVEIRGFGELRRRESIWTTALRRRYDGVT